MTVQLFSRERHVIERAILGHALYTIRLIQLVHGIVDHFFLRATCRTRLRRLISTTAAAIREQINRRVRVLATKTRKTRRSPSATGRHGWRVFEHKFWPRENTKQTIARIRRRRRSRLFVTRTAVLEVAEFQSRRIKLGCCIQTIINKIFIQLFIRFLAA